MSNTFPQKASIDITNEEFIFPHIDDYSKILEGHGLVYKESDVYLQVGEINQTQGWILHISVVISEINTLFAELLPILSGLNIPFKIPANKTVAVGLLYGNLGIEKIGKIICIYPQAAEKTDLIDLLIKSTKNFRGPGIPTDVHLGGTLYTRYGSFNPLYITNSSGTPEPHIYNANGEPIPDLYTIPFSLPEGIEWPFLEFASPYPNQPKGVFHQKYKPILTLKFDAKGSVTKSLYLKGLFKIKWCVIKEGKKHMWSDNAGRDIQDRLLWQQRLHLKFADTVPLPKVLDLFSENGNSYLVMEYIRGKSLAGYMTAIHKDSLLWTGLSRKDQARTLDFILQIVSILEELHKNGYVHRDITPVNFLIARQNRLYIIDNELAYSTNDQSPDPPFEAGTPGFMSPEQLLQKVPTIKEDIYGLGATIIALLTGLSPIAFCMHTPDRLQNSLYFLIEDKSMAKIIAACLHASPSERIELSSVKSEVALYKNRIQTQEKKTAPAINFDIIDEEELKDLIQKAIRGISMPPTAINDGLWYSKSLETTGNPNINTGFIKHTGLREGIAGVLYFLARAQLVEYNISPCIDAYYNGWKFIEDSSSSSSPGIPPGLYGGAAGISLAIAAGLRAGLVNDNDANRSLLQQCLELPNENPDIADGIAGQGISLINCRDFIDEKSFKIILNRYVDHLIRKDTNMHNWIQPTSKNIYKDTSLSFAKGNSGIAWFLLKYLSIESNSSVKEPVLAAINLQRKSNHRLTSIIKIEGYRKISQCNPNIVEHLYGQIMIHIKAFEITQNSYYKEEAEKMLFIFPAKISNDNFYQDSGLSGLGELYLEAYKSLNNPEWLKRAQWLVQFFWHTSHKGNSECFWLGGNYLHPTADFLVGNTGIIHFLMRYLDPDKLGYRILE